MPSRILLVSANRCVHPDPVFPLGLGYVSAALRQAGHECIWLDSLADEQHFVEKLKGCKADFAGISIRNIDDVLIRHQETYYESIAGLVSFIRQELKCPVILGGSGFSIFPEQLVAVTGADFGIVGEAEQSFVELIATLERKQTPYEIPGLIRHKGNSSVTRELQPERPGAVADYYLNTGSMLNVQTQRGCAFRCCYCTYPVIEGRSHRRHNPEIVADEFERVAQSGARYVFIVDSVFNSSPQHVIETCEALISRGNKLRWGCFLRPKGLTPEQMKLLARAGLSHIEFGSDSFCDEVLVEYQKDFSFADILASSHLAQQHNIDYCHFLISGGPGETYETLEAGFRNSLQLEGAVIMAVVGMRVYPETELYRRAIAEGRIDAKTDLLKPVYYLGHNVTADGVFAKLQEFSGRSPNWIIGDPDPAYQKLVSRLRQRGVAGPLWSYFSMIQRLWPQGLTTTPATANARAQEVAH